MGLPPPCLSSADSVDAIVEYELVVVEALAENLEANKSELRRGLSRDAPVERRVRDANFSQMMRRRLGSSGLIYPQAETDDLSGRDEVVVQSGGAHFCCAMTEMNDRHLRSLQTRSEPAPFTIDILFAATQKALD